MKSIRNIWMIVLMAWASPGLLAQDMGVTVRLDSSSILIGDQVPVVFELTVPAGSKVTWPLFADTLARGVEILRMSGIDTVASGSKKFTLRQELLITSFDSGNYVIRPVPFKFHQKSDTTQYYTQTRPVYLTVNAPETDQAGDIRPIKPPLKAPLTFAELAPWLAGLLLAALLALAIVYYLKRKKARRPIFQVRPKPKRPPHEVALGALEALKQKKLWQSGRVKDYYSEMTDIIRLYVEDRFRIRALEMTTEEIQQALQTTEAPVFARSRLHETLVSADLVKFAKAQPLPLENDHHLTQCVEFVRETKPVVDLRQSDGAEPVTTTQQMN